MVMYQVMLLIPTVIPISPDSVMYQARASASDYASGNYPHNTPYINYKYSRGRVSGLYLGMCPAFCDMVGSKIACEHLLLTIIYIWEYVLHLEP